MDKFFKINKNVASKMRWFDVYSDAKIETNNKGDKVVSFPFTQNGNLIGYKSIKDFTLPELKNIIGIYNRENPENLATLKGATISKQEGQRILTRLIAGDSEAYISYAKRLSKATGVDIKQMSARDLERSKELFEALKRHPSKPLKNDAYSSEGIIKEVWRLTRSKVKFSDLEGEINKWLEAHGDSSDFRRYTDEEAEEIIQSMQNEFNEEQFKNDWEAEEVPLDKVFK